MFHALLSWMLALPMSNYDAEEHWTARIERIALIAEAINTVAKGDPTLAAFLAVQAAEESGLRSDVQACSCPANHCDQGLAHGPWQIQHNPRIPFLWSEICKPGLRPQTLGAAYIARFYRHRTLQEAFRMLGGSFASPGSPSVLKRVRKTRELAGLLRSSEAGE